MRRTIGIVVMAALLLAISLHLAVAGPSPSRIKEVANYSPQGFSLDIGVAQYLDSEVGVSSGWVGCRRRTSSSACLR